MNVRTNLPAALLLLSLGLLPFTPCPSAFAQMYGMQPGGPWGPWIGFSQYPNLQARVKCEYSMIDTNDHRRYAMWAYEYRSSYDRPVDVVSAEGYYDTVSKTNKNYDAPGLFTIQPGREGGSGETSLLGGCVGGVSLAVYCVVPKGQTDSCWQNGALKNGAPSPSSLNAGKVGGSKPSGATTLTSSSPQKGALGSSSSNAGNPAGSQTSGAATSAKRPDNGTNKSIGCDPNWSSKLNAISDPQVRQMVDWHALGSQKAYIDEYVRRLGSLDKFIQGAQEAETQDKQLLLDHQNAGDTAGVAKLKQLMLFNEGMIDIGRCRASLGRDPIGVAPPEAPEHAEHTEQAGHAGQAEPTKPTMSDTIKYLNTIAEADPHLNNIADADPGWTKARSRLKYHMYSFNGKFFVDTKKRMIWWSQVQYDSSSTMVALFGARVSDLPSSIGHDDIEEDSNDKTRSISVNCEGSGTCVQEWFVGPLKDPQTARAYLLSMNEKPTNARLASQDINGFLIRISGDDEDAVIGRFGSAWKHLIQLVQSVPAATDPNDPFAQ